MRRWRGRACRHAAPRLRAGGWGGGSYPPLGPPVPRPTRPPAWAGPQTRWTSRSAWAGSLRVAVGCGVGLGWCVGCVRKWGAGGGAVLGLPGIAALSGERGGLSTRTLAPSDRTGEENERGEERGVAQADLLACRAGQGAERDGPAVGAHRRCTQSADSRRCARHLGVLKARCMPCVNGQWFLSPQLLAAARPAHPPRRAPPPAPPAHPAGRRQTAAGRSGRPRPSSCTCSPAGARGQRPGSWGAAWGTPAGGVPPRSQG